MSTEIEIVVKFSNINNLFWAHFKDLKRIPVSLHAFGRGRTEEAAVRNLKNLTRLWHEIDKLLKKSDEYLAK